MNILYAGPYIGEFGWELCWYNPIAREKAKKFDKIIVAAHKNSEYLYEFADEFIPLDAEGWCNAKGECKTPLPKVNASVYLNPLKMSFNAYGIHTGLQWRKLSPLNCVKKADIMCAFRPPKIHPKSKQIIAGKDYPQSECVNLIELLLDSGLSVACYGGPKNYHFDGTIDLRDMCLKDLCSALGGAKCAIGPSSGTMHLASLCGCPHITWYAQQSTWPPHKTLDLRYKKIWNPFITPVDFLGNISPTPPMILHAVEKMISCEQKE